MAEQSGFFNSNVVNGEYDRIYLAEQFAEYFASFIGNGIFGGKSDELMVLQPANAGMKIEVLSGMAWINGFWYKNTSKLSLDISVADGVLNRIDNVVIKFGKAERLCWAEIVRGTPATNAVAPSVQRNTDYYELKIAEVHVRAGATRISQADIVDTRLNSEVCGFVVGLIQQFDTTEFGKQLNGYISDYAAEYKAYLEELELNGTQEINSLIERLNAIVEDESAFATLVLKTDNAASEAALASQTLGYSKKNLIPYPYMDTTKNTSGIQWTDNGDGTVTANGTATANTTFRLYIGEIPGNTILSGGLGTNARIQIVNRTNDTYTVLARDEGQGNGSKVDISKYNNGYIEIVIIEGQTVSNVTFKPMLRRAEILDDTWEPYKLSVAESLSMPNKPGVEYLLAERWNDKPVYQKTLYVATLPNNSIVGIEVDAAYTEIVSINGYAIDTDNNYYHPFPVIVSGVTPIAVIAGFEGDGGDGGTVVLRTNTDATNYQAYITVKYTKT